MQISQDGCPFQIAKRKVPGVLKSNASGHPRFRRILMCLMMLSALPATAQTVADESGLRTLFQEQEAAWNCGDGAAFASAFTEDSDFINVRGDLFHGRTMIAARHTAILSGPLKGSHNMITVRTLKAIGTDLVIVETDHTTTDFHSLPPGILATSPGMLRTRMTYVAKREDGKWSLVYAQNTAVAAAPAVASH
jgi:uncharacterized protein (TIGR02246 family)